MTVYVDDMSAPYGRMKMCHMLADSEAELHQMADLIGVARRWHQGDHYDIALSKRALAVGAGAVEITLRQAGCMHMRRRATGELGSPADAEAWARAAIRLRQAQREAGRRHDITIDNGGDVEPSAHDPDGAAIVVDEQNVPAPAAVELGVNDTARAARRQLDLF